MNRPTHTFAKEEYRRADTNKNGVLTAAEKLNYDTNRRLQATVATKSLGQPINKVSVTDSRRLQEEGGVTCEQGALFFPPVMGHDAGECAEGYEQIRTAERCQEAADSVGASLQIGTWDDNRHVKDCYAEAEDRFYFNVDGAGTVQNDDTHSGPVCERTCPQPPPTPCEGTLEDGFCYTIVEENVWHDAEAACVSGGGHLASIHTAAQAQLVARLCNGAVEPTPDNRYCWIGFNDEVTEGAWLWADGSDTVYTNWAAPEPNNHGPGEHCGIIVPRDVNMNSITYQTGEFLDTKCINTWDTFYGVCQTPASPCSISPCQNGGTCTDESDQTFSCECSAGYGGQACDIDAMESCSTILAHHPEATSGAYSIDPAGTGDSVQVYCDMETDGGGWTQIEYVQGGDGEGFSQAYAAVFSNVVRGTRGSGSYKIDASTLIQSASEFRYSEPSVNTNDPQFAEWTYDFRCAITDDVRSSIANPGSANQPDVPIECTNVNTGVISTSATRMNYQGWTGGEWNPVSPRLSVHATADAPQFHGDYCVDCVVTWKKLDHTDGIYSGPSSGTEPWGGYSVAFWVRSVEDPDWLTALVSAEDDGTFAYASAAWQSSDVIDMANGNQKTAAFSMINVESVRVTMNGQSRTWDLDTDHSGKHTLKELVNWDDRENAPLAIDAEGFVGTTTNVWGLTRDGHETFNCDALGFNFDTHSADNNHGQARIGFSLSQEYPCGHPGTAEGVGLGEPAHGASLGSGRVQWSSESHYFVAATVEVKGPRRVPAGVSCDDALAHNPDAQSGTYPIQIGDEVINVHCEMTAETGWMLLLTQTDAVANIEGAEVPFLHDLNRETPSISAPYARDWSYTGLGLVPEPGDEFLIQRQSTGDSVRMVIDEWCGWDDGSAPACGGVGGHPGFAHGRMFDADGDLVDTRFFNGCSGTTENPDAGNGCGVRDVDGVAFTTNDGWANGDSRGGNCYGGCWNGDGGSFYWDGQQLGSETVSVFYRRPPAQPRAVSCKDVLSRDPNAQSGVYLLQPVGSQDSFEAECNMEIEGGPWTKVADITTSGSAWEYGDQDGNLGALNSAWESSNLFGDVYDSETDYKGPAWNRVPKSAMMVTFNGELLLRTDECKGGQTMRETFNGLEFNVAHPDQDSTCSPWKTCVDDDHTCAIAQYNTPSGEVSLINGEAVADLYLKYGERDGAEDGNKDRAYLSTDARGTATNQVDYPQGLGSFVSFSGDERTVNVGIHDDGAVAAPAGGSYGIFVKAIECGQSELLAAESCGAIRQYCPGAPDGDYFIDPDGPGGAEPFQLRCGPCPSAEVLRSCRRHGRAECEVDAACTLCGEECYPSSTRHDGACGPDRGQELQDCIYAAEEPSNLLLNANLDTAWEKDYAEPSSILWNDILPPGGLDLGGRPGIIGATGNVVSFENGRSDVGVAGYWYSYANMAPMEAGRPYTATGWFRANEDGVRVRMYTADNTEAGRVWGDFQTLSRAWQRFEWPFVNPVGSQAESLSFNFDGAAVSTTPGVRVWLAAPQLVEGAYPCGESEQRAALSCSSIRLHCPAAESGLFWIDEDGVAWRNNDDSKVGGNEHEPDQQYCHMGTGTPALDGASDHVAVFDRFSCSLDGGTTVRVCLPPDSPTYDGLSTVVSLRQLTAADFSGGLQPSDDWFVLTQQDRCHTFSFTGPLETTHYNASHLHNRSELYFERVLSENNAVSMGHEYVQGLVCYIDKHERVILGDGDEQSRVVPDDVEGSADVVYETDFGPWDGTQIVQTTEADTAIPVSEESAAVIRAVTESHDLAVLNVYALFAGGGSHRLSATDTTEAGLSRVCAKLPAGEMIRCVGNTCTVVWETLYEYLPLVGPGQYEVEVHVETRLLATGEVQHDSCKKYFDGTVTEEGRRALEEADGTVRDHAHRFVYIVEGPDLEVKMLEGSLTLPVDIESSEFQLADVQSAVAPKLSTAFSAAGMTSGVGDFAITEIAPGSVVVHFTVALPAAMATDANQQSAAAIVADPGLVGLPANTMSIQLMVQGTLHTITITELEVHAQEAPRVVIGPTPPVQSNASTGSDAQVTIVVDRDESGVIDDYFVDDDGDEWTTPVIVGFAGGGAVVVCLVAVIVYLLCRFGVCQKGKTPEEGNPPEKATQP